jgi:hypothetical protein
MTQQAQRTASHAPARNAAPAIPTTSPPLDHPTAGIPGLSLLPADFHTQMAHQAHSMTLPHGFSFMALPPGMPMMVPHPHAAAMTELPTSQPMAAGGPAAIRITPQRDSMSGGVDVSLMGHHQGDEAARSPTVNKKRKTLGGEGEETRSDRHGKRGSNVLARKAQVQSHVDRRLCGALSWVL